MTLVERPSNLKSNHSRTTAQLLWRLHERVTDRRATSTPPTSPSVDLVQVDRGRRLLAEPRHRTLDPGAARPRSDGHHGAGRDQLAEALLVRERVAGPQGPHAGGRGAGAHRRGTAQHARTAANRLPPHLLLHSHLQDILRHPLQVSVLLPYLQVGL